MRMRRKKHGAERIAACAEILISDPVIPAVDPNTYFTTERPIHLEIGCGKGDFAVGMSAKYPEYNFIAMERVPDVACLALEKAMQRKRASRQSAFSDRRCAISGRMVCTALGGLHLSQFQRSVA